MAFSGVDRQKLVARVQTLHSGNSHSSGTVMRQAQNDLDGHTESNAVLGFAIPTQSIVEHFGAGHTALEKARTDNVEFDTAWAADEANNAGALNGLASCGVSGCQQEQRRQRGLGSGSLFEGLCGELKASANATQVLQVGTGAAQAHTHALWQES